MAAQIIKDESIVLAESPAALSGQEESPASILPGLRPSLTEVPVTPGFHPAEYEKDRAEDGSPGYFTQNPARLPGRSKMAQTPGEAAEGEPSNREILRRMSNASRPRGESLSIDLDPRAAYPELELTGNIISATFCIPNSLKFRKGADWTLGERRGTSALFDSFTHLSSDKTPWNHTLVGWTGEISPADDLTPPTTPTGPPAAYKVPPLNKSSAPIPFEGFVTPEDPEKQVLCITKADQARLEFQLGHKKDCKTVPVWLYDEADTPPGGLSKTEGFYLKDQAKWRRYAEFDLYTLFHYKQHEPTNGRAERKSFADYVYLNQKFANRILELYKPGDIVLINDYHLLLLPQMLRQKIPNMYISFFLHIPFPSSEFMRCLPQRSELLKGVLHADMVAFQTHSFSRHFSSCCTRIVKFPSSAVGVQAYGKTTFVGVNPIGIDAVATEKLAFNPAIDAQVAALKKMWAGKKIIVGRDRLDSVRGVPQKLMAFERFLLDHPEWREKVVLIQVTSPTNAEEEKEDSGNKIANKVSELVSKINGTYGSLKFSPVQHYPQYLSQDEYLALLRVADLALITSVRDGMNTTCLEYIVCQRDNHSPVILSEFSGTAGTLASAIQINPWDMAGVSREINSALLMSEEKKTVLHHDLYNHVTSKDLKNWSSAYIRNLLGGLSKRAHIATRPLDTVKLVEQYKSASKRLFMFDYDGTLTPIVGNPMAAIPTQRVISTLTALASDPQNEVWIISGRDQDFLSKYLGHIAALGFSAEHGSFMRHPGSSEWENLAETTDMGWQKEVMACFQEYTEMTPGSFIERKRCALTWHYRPSDPALGAANARKCQDEMERTVGRAWDVEVMAGKANLEVRPTFINKGEIAKRLVLAHGESPPQFALCLGDDFTDEDMFRALNASGLNSDHFFTVAVGASTKPTLAGWFLPEPADVISSIALLNGGEIDGTEVGPSSVADGKVVLDVHGDADAPHHLPGA